MAASFVSLSFILAGGQLFAQSQAIPSSSDPPVLHFTKPANTIVPMSPSTDIGPTITPQSGMVSPPAPNPPAAAVSQGTMYFEPAPATPELTPTIVPPTPVQDGGHPAGKDSARPDRDEGRGTRGEGRGARAGAPLPSSLAPDPSPLFDDMSRLRLVSYQAPMPGAQTPTGGASEELQYHLQLEPPGLRRLIRLDSEKQLDERLRQEARERPNPERIQFPQEPIISREKYVGRHFAHSEEVVEPNYLVYERLYFEERNSERYGWDLGIVQPVVSTAAFFWDVATLPYHLATDPCRKYDSSAGQCLPGDPVPYLLYPPTLSVSGAVAEAGTIFVLLAVFP
jgi:hypothetical protein